MDEIPDNLYPFLINLIANNTDKPRAKMCLYYLSRKFDVPAQYHDQILSYIPELVPTLLGDHIPDDISRYVVSQYF
jgi:hypothetical protein